MPHIFAGNALICRDPAVMPMSGRAHPGVRWIQEASQASAQGAVMADKSPRQHMSKKAGKSLKEKRAEKHIKSEAKSKTQIVPPDKHR
jgi:hypothetical protein